MAGIYRERHPEHTVFYRVFFYYFERLLMFSCKTRGFCPSCHAKRREEWGEWKILRWRHTGFNIHSQVRKQTKREAERVGKYMIRYYGLYSNAHRGKIHKAQQAANPLFIIEHEEPFVPSKGWAEMIRKVYEVNPLICSSCGGRMRVISFIEEPKTIDRIIRYLELTFETERPPPPHHVQQDLLMAAEESREYF